MSFVPLADMLGSRMLSALRGAEEVHTVSTVNLAAERSEEPVASSSSASTQQQHERSTADEK